MRLASRHRARHSPQATSFTTGCNVPHATILIQLQLSYAVSLKLIGLFHTQQVHHRNSFIDGLENLQPQADFDPCLMHQETGQSLPRRKFINKGTTRKKSTDTPEAQRDCISESVKQRNAVSRMIVSGIQYWGGSATPAAAMNTEEYAERVATFNRFLRPKRQEVWGLCQCGDCLRELLDPGSSCCYHGGVGS